jgi:hypothetical protein
MGEEINVTILPAIKNIYPDNTLQKFPFIIEPPYSAPHLKVARNGITFQEAQT